MPDSHNKLSQFWQELKRRRVIHVIIVYATAAFVIIELVNNVYETLRLPDWTPALTLIILAIGFPLAIIFSWIFDVTPEGIEKTKPAEELRKGEKTLIPNSWRIAAYVSFVVIIGLLALNIFKGRNYIKIDESLEKSIAVLPFADMSPDKDQEYFCDGITEEIINSLTQVNELKVIARTSSFAFKGKNDDIREIGKMLGVESLVEGSIQKVGNQLRITAQLIEVKDGSNLWSQRFDRELKDIFAIQDEISAFIVENLKVKLLSEKSASIDKHQTESVEAYDLYLQGRYFWSQGGKEKSIEYYKKALEVDPNYALAYSGIAATYISYAWHGLAPRRDVLPQAKAAAMKALELDSILGEAHAELAFARLIYDWNWTESEREFKRALELNPSYAYAHWGYSWLLTYIGRHEEAIQEARRAHELNPLDIDLWGLYGRLYYYARDYDRAIEEYSKILELYPNHSDTRNLLALALVQNGNYQEAIEECQKLESLSVIPYQVGYVYGIVGEKEKAMEVLDNYLEKAKNEFVHNANIFFIYAALNNKDSAFKWLERTYDEMEAYIGLLQVEPMFDNLRSDPRFQNLVERMNFPE